MRSVVVKVTASLVPKVERRKECLMSAAWVSVHSPKILEIFVCHQQKEKLNSTKKMADNSLACAKIILYIHGRWECLPHTHNIFLCVVQKYLTVTSSINAEPAGTILKG